MTTLRLIEFVPPAVEAIAASLGLFERRGLELDVERPRSAGEKRELMMADDGDAVLTAIDNLIAWDAEGDDLRLVAQVERTTVLDLMAQPDVADVADLRGRTLAVDAVDTGFAIVLRKLLRTHGVRDDEYDLLGAGGINQRFEALKQERAAAGLLGPPWSVRAADAGLRRLASVEDELPTFPGIGLAVRAARVTELTDALERYLAALQDAMAWVSGADVSAARARLAAAGFDERGARALMAVWPSTLTPSREGVELLIDIRRELGVLPEAAPAIDELILPLIPIRSPVP